MNEPPNLSPFLGYWKITHMETWAQDYVDLVVPGFIEFTYEQDEDRLMGRVQFGTVSGWLDCRLRDIEGVTFVEWSWQGQSDTDPAGGRGWAHVVESELVGRIFIHNGDDSAFRAAKQSRPAERPTPTSTRGAEPETRRVH